MGEKANLNELINAFDVRVTNLFFVTSFNGFYSVDNYKRYLDLMITQFKVDVMSFLLTKEQNNKEVFLKYLRLEINNRKKRMAHIFKRFQKNIFVHKCHEAKLISYFQKLKANFSGCRKVKYMYYLLQKKIAKITSVIKQIASLFNVTFNHKKVDLPQINPNIYWDSEKGKIGFIQSLLSLSKMGYLKHKGLTQKQMLAEIGKYFKIDVNNVHYQSFRRAVLSNNYDYSPEIFSDIEKGYKYLEEEIISEAAKNNKK